MNYTKYRRENCKDCCYAKDMACIGYCMKKLLAKDKEREKPDGGEKDAGISR